MFLSHWTTQANLQRHMPPHLLTFRWKQIHILKFCIQRTRQWTESLHAVVQSLVVEAMTG